MATNTAQVFVYENGSDHEFTFSVVEKKDVLAKNVAVAIKAYTRDLDEDGNRIEETNITISAVSLPVGSYSNGVWTLGNIQNVTHNGLFKFTINNDLVTNFYIETVVNTDSVEVSTSNNRKEVEYVGLRQDSFDKGLHEDLVEVPSSAFADTNKPTDAELRTWIDANLADYQKNNGTRIVYNPDPLVWNEVWDNILIDVYASFLSTTGRINNISINGTFYYPPTTNYDAGDLGVFDEAAFKTFVENSMATEGVTGTVSVVEDGSGASLTITNQTGIDNFELNSYSYTGIFADTAIKSTDNGNFVGYSYGGGNAGWDYIWTLHPNGSDYQISLESKADKDGDIIYVSTNAEDDPASLLDRPEIRKGDRGYPISSLNKAFTGVVQDGDTIYVFPGSYTEVTNVANGSNEDVNDFTIIAEGATIHINSAAYYTDQFIGGQAPIKNQNILGYPNIHLDFPSKLISNRHPESTTKIELGNVYWNSSSGRIFEGQGKDIDIHIKRIIGNAGSNIVSYQGLVTDVLEGGNPAYFMGDDTNISVVVDDFRATQGNVLLSFKPYLNNVGQTISRLNLFVHVKNMISGTNTPPRLIDFDNATPNNPSGFIDSFLHTKLDNVKDSYAGSYTYKNPYTYATQDAILNRCIVNLTDSKWLIEGGNFNGYRTLFNTNPVDYGSFVSKLDNSTYHIKGFKGRVKSHFYSLVLGDNTVNLSNNSKIIFEDLDITVGESYFADFDLRPAQVNNDNTTEIIFRNCRIKTERAATPVLYVRSDVVKLYDCVFENDGTVPSIQSDYGSGVTVYAYNFKTNDSAVGANITFTGETVFRDPSVQI